jgi:CRISPR/Cas system-associated protein Csm6
MYTYHQIVATAGISLFANFNIYGTLAREQNLFKFNRSNPLPLADEDAAAALERWRGLCRNFDLDAAAAKPQAVSAEYSLLNALCEQGRLGPNPRVTLVVTRTLGGQAAGALLELLLKRHFSAVVDLNVVDDIQVDERERLRRSMGSFMQEVAQALQGNDRSSTCFAPVGGYKVMTSLGYLAGAYMGFPTAYLHEDNQVLHEIPAVPIQIGRSELQAMGDLLRRARYDTLEWQQLSYGEQQQINSHPYLFERVDELVTLNAFGEFLAQRPENAVVFGARVSATPDVEAILRSGQGDFVAREIRELLKKLEQAKQNPAANWGELKHEKAFAGLRDQHLAYSLYKGASNSSLAVRMAYRTEHNGGALFLNRVWTDHNRYEREAEQGQGLREANNVDWRDLSDLIWDKE